MAQTNIGTITFNEKEAITEVTIKLLKPNDKIEKLQYYGFDWVRNIYDYIKWIYFEICENEKADN